MKKITAILTALAIILTAVICSGCGNGLKDDYNKPSPDFKGLNFECVTDGDTLNQIRNRMVYFDLSEFIIEDQKKRGNILKTIDVDEANAEVFHEKYSVANIGVAIESESGDIPSGNYRIEAMFAYNNDNASNVKMYLLNYCFVSGSKITTDVFEESYQAVKDKKIP